MELLRGLIAGGVRNPVLVNLLMACMLVGGWMSARGMVREAYPEASLDHIAIEVAYPGASAFDVERAITTPIEEAMRGVRGVRKVSSSANENFGTVWVGLRSGVTDAAPALKEIKDRVDLITDWPSQAEKPIVYETFVRGAVINVAIYGDASERTLKRIAQEVENDLSVYQEISQISLSGVRDDEIIIEVSEEALLAYDLTLSQVMAVVAKSSMDLPAGVLRTSDEEVTLRVTGQRYRAVDYEDLVILEQGDADVRLGDIATVSEGFEERVVRGRFNGEPAVVVQVFKTPDEDATTIAGRVRNYVASRQEGLPERLQMSVWADGSLEIDSRIGMLVENGVIGILLVFLTLTVFLDLRLSFWVVVGIPVSFAGALIVMAWVGATINMISLFALIMVSGIIVDDAIVIAESIHTRRQAGDQPELASINGAYRMALPVLGASATTIIAFIPLLYVVGVMGKLIHILPVVVIGAVCASAIEAFVVLPAHLCHRDPPGVKRKARPKPRLRQRIDAAIEHVIARWYRPAFRLSIRYRAVTISIALCATLVITGLILGGRTPVVLLPKEDSNRIRVRVRFPEGSPVALAERTADRIEAAAMALNDDPSLRTPTGEPLVRQVHSIVGEFVDFLPVRGSNLCETNIELMPAEQRKVRAELVMERWREHIGPIHDATEFRMNREQLIWSDRPIEIRLLGHDLGDLADAADRVQAKLSEFEGVTNVASDLIPGKREMRVTLKPTARALGLTLDDVARQLRQGFYGGEAVRLYRGRDQVKVRVRYPDDERRSIVDLESLRITTPLGQEVPFLAVADVTWARGYAGIMHQDAKRRVRVTADIDFQRANAERITQTMEAGFLDEVVADYNDMSWEFGGDREMMTESLVSLRDGFVIALIGVYTVLASMLRSYIQPLVIVAAVPFGLIGAVAGHAIMGLDLTMMSLFGVVALSGVVVNDSLVLLDGINVGVREGKSLADAVHDAGEQRFRPVVLTSITTVAGLMPLLAERSSHAQSVIPMATSLAYGILFATGLTLFVVPAIYVGINDGRRALHWLRYGGAYPRPELVEEAAADRGLALE